MKTMLKISILLNVLLLCSFVFLLAPWRRTGSPVAPPAQLDAAPSAVEAAVPATAVSAKSDERPFHWSQVESSDYPTYIANLRSVGCPEQTIHDIIAADVDSVYASRRQVLEDKLATNGVAGRIALQRELQQLGNQEAAAVTTLLAAPPIEANTTSALAAETPASGSARQEQAGRTAMPPFSQNAAPSPSTLNTKVTAVGLEAPPSNSARKAPPAPISLPLVFQETDPAMLTLNSQQAQVVNDLRQKFIQDVGGPNQDPNDPAYSQRWQAYQPQTDLDLRGMIGIRAWEGYQIAAWAKAHAQPPSEP
jgi:hypothetical protein